MEEKNSFFGLTEKVVDRDGKYHEIYSCKLKDLNKLTEFTSKYNPMYLQVQMLDIWYDDNGEPKQNENGQVMYMYQNDSFMNGIYEVIELALNYKETKEQILEWLDFKLIEEIITIFLGLSQFKKKVM